MMKQTPLELAIAAAGGAPVLAKKLGLSKQAVYQWRACPPKQVLTVEKLTGVSRYDLRPDIYGKRAA